MPARKLPDEAQKNLIDNNKKIGLLLMNNETILKENGFNPPAENFEFKDYKSKIRIPAGYVRKKDYYVQKYGLEKICDGNRDMIKNIAYSLQLTDFNNYIITRMGLFGSVLAMMHKQATINFVSIIEGLIKS
ncbi:MAG: hypothetical protein K6A90_05295, partial [Lachnospiraceae bacterium]|nr:hypothetical protein [Lachnospiraceae bacterium]